MGGDSYLQIIQLVIAVTPHGVAQVVAFADNSQGFVRVVVVQVISVFALGHDDAPHLDIDVFLTIALSFDHGVACQWHCFTIQVWSWRGSGNVQESCG